MRAIGLRTSVDRACRPHQGSSKTKMSMDTTRPFNVKTLEVSTAASLFDSAKAASRPTSD